MKSHTEAHKTAHMEQIYEVKGTLNKGFVGQISYTICLDKAYEEMDICFSFEKQRYETITEELKQELLLECAKDYSAEIAHATDEDICNHIREMKTEIHTLASMNDVFIGGIHRQSTTRHMYFSANEATDGCIPQSSIDGVIKITLVVFNVILDETPYSLTLCVK